MPKDESTNSNSEAVTPKRRDAVFGKSETGKAAAPSRTWSAAKIAGVSAVHELHIWKLSGNKIIATAHVTCHDSQEYMMIAAKIKEFFHHKGIHSTTIQPEFLDVSV